MSDMVRMSFSLPEDVMDMLDQECAHLGCSRSALVSVIVGRAVGQIGEALSIDADQAPLLVFDSDRKRLRGKSRETIQSEVIELLELGI